MGRLADRNPAKPIAVWAIGFQCSSRPALFEGWQLVTVSGGNRNVVKPADTIAVNELWVRSPSDLKWLECPRRSFGYALSYSPTESVTGVPRFYSEFDEDDIGLEDFKIDDDLWLE